jgi:crotonyl-CoA carboxylase/reductase
MAVDASQVSQLDVEPGELPPTMAAWVIREERQGEPIEAFQLEEMEVPEPGAFEVIVRVMAAGVNFNNVWAALGQPVSVFRYHDEDHHIGGSDASGVVWKVGEGVTRWKPGDEVVMHCNQASYEDPEVHGLDPLAAPSQQIWGYETTWGSFAQFCKVQAHQLMPKAPHLTWEEAAAPTLTGATAYRMLHGWAPNTVQEGDVVLVWGGAGGLGSLATQLVAAAGAKAVTVVSSDEKGEYTKKLGAVGYINRKEYDHWGIPPHWEDSDAWAKWFSGAKAFGKAIWEQAGERKSPAIVFEHPGEDTIPTSIFVADRGGMVVICAGTTGYSATVDLRFLWNLQKRFQGSHLFNDEQAMAFNQLVIDGKIDPALGHAYNYDEVGHVHQLMGDGNLPEGNMSVLISAPREGLKDLP